MLLSRQRLRIVLMRLASRCRPELLLGQKVPGPEPIARETGGFTRR